MTAAEEILKLIESVDPSDSATKKQIEIKVWNYLNPDKPRKFYAIPRYTRSRDALKAIRPDGYTFGVVPLDGYYCANMFENPTDGFSSGLLRTEELAELHAIIQAIQHYRETK